MAEGEDLNTKQSSGGVYVEVTGNGETKSNHRDDVSTLDAVLRRLVADIYSSDKNAPVFNRIKSSLSDTFPLLPEASRNTGRDVLIWARRGSPLRALLVASVGTIGVVTFTGLSVFMVFFLAATVNAIVISLLMSLAAAGGFLAIFFACLMAVYIGALSIAAFVISAVTISAVIAAFIATGWIGFFFVVWLVTKKSLDIAKHSLTTTGSAISAYKHSHHRHRD
ncbi:uncharacterized protein LOC124919413 [Impatiens glandulifera]|uniref:uncharacterized protein LOC124919413 n=1 Tax=Impatiens glandulifera TaxID=253017 RepID=UPI001FB11B17|nr:uncharacterized protein LOC124919413 [Impatiens glandulifera]